MYNRKVTDDATVSQFEKEANDKQWYKDEIDKRDIEGSHSTTGMGGISEYRRRKVNYDLCNNILNISDFEYVCMPFGAEAGELPAKMVNRDIISGPVKSMVGMEMKRPFSWKAMATNREATTRRETEETNRIREYVISEIMKPIRQRIELKYQEQLKGGNLTEQEQANIQQQIQEELYAETPDRVRQYMEREHQDPSEVLAHQILQYITQEQQLSRKFNKGWEHAMKSAYEVYWVGILNGKPMMKWVNPLRFSHDKSPDLEFIEKGEWASCEYRMMPSEVVTFFHEELDEKQINSIYNEYSYYTENDYIDRLFDFSKSNEEIEDEGNTVRVLHVTWKALRKLGFLTYIDKETGNSEMMIVSEDYRLDFNNGDISLEWEWIPEVYEGYKIGADIYVGMQPIPGQFKDMNNLYDTNLPYMGAIHDNMNSQPTSLVDRMKVYQYYYNIVMYRLELLLASDKGKKVLMNINAIPESAGIDIEKWQYFFESTPFMWYNPDEEGVGYNDVNTMAKQIDLSLASDIGKYIEFAEYLRKKCGESVGLPDTVLGQISPSAEVGNTKQQIVQTSHILEPYFDLHNHVKKNVLEHLLNVAKIAYIENPPDTLTYGLDDMSRHTLTVDVGLLENSTIGIFVSNSAKSEETKDLIRQLAHAAMQNQMAELSDVIAVVRQEGTQEAEETLKAAETKKKREAQKEAEAERNNKLQISREAREWEEKKMDKEHNNKMEEIKLKGGIDLQRQAMLSVGFNEDKDVDDDGKLDVLEVYNAAQNAEIVARKQKLDEDKFQEDKKQFRIEEKRRQQELKIKEKQANKNTKNK
jgi:hypothetical protein